MAIYLKKFETTAAYNAAKPNLILPNVSLITENNNVEYNPSTPPTPSHDYVEIAGIKWATMNIGANSPTDAGKYFQWGDINGYTASQVGTDKVFNWTNYKFNPSGDGETFIKYNSTDGKTVLDAEDDAVRANWGGNWRTPTVSEWEELGEAVNTAWTQVNGVYGLQCTDKTDSSKVLFFPAVGYCYNSSMDSIGSGGFYWSSSLDTFSGDGLAYRMLFYSDYVIWADGEYGMLCNGYSIRGVLDE